MTFHIFVNFLKMISSIKSSFDIDRGGLLDRSACHFSDLSRQISLSFLRPYVAFTGIYSSSK